MIWGRSARVTAVLASSAVFVAAIGTFRIASNHGQRVRLTAPPEQPIVTTEAPTTTASTEVPTTEAPTTAPPPPTTAAPTTAPPTTAKPRPVVKAVPKVTVPAVPSAAAFHGLGTWIDVYDWTATYTNNNPQISEADIDHMAQVGVQTLYVQASRADNPDDVMEPERLRPLIDRAHAKGMRVVAWYLPTLEDPAHDLARMLAMAKLPVEGLGVDIEARNVSDVNDRNQRLIALSADLRKALPKLAIAAIVLPPVVLEVVNTNYWPNFPWKAIAGSYDLWMPMTYWTNRTQSSGYRDAYRYTSENISRMRTDLGLPNAIVHPIGGIGDKTTAADDDAYLKAASEAHAVGGSVYDWRTTAPDTWSHLQGFHAP